MKGKIRYQSRADLRGLRCVYGFSKEYVAEYIAYSTRSLERIETENAVTHEETARKLCELYRIDFEEQFYRVNQDVEKWIMTELSNQGNIPENTIDDEATYYCIYIRKQSVFRDCIAGKGLWLRDYNRNKEVRRLRAVDVKKVILHEPEITIINTAKEWKYWYFQQCIGCTIVNRVDTIFKEKYLRTVA